MKKVFILNKTILNILSNFSSHELVTVDDNDSPWFTKNISYKRKTMSIKAIEIVKTITKHNT